MFEFIYSKDCPDHISVSQINKFLKCQVSYYFSYLTTLPRPKIARMIHGSAIHAGIANHLINRLDGSQNVVDSTDVAVEYFKKDVADDLNVLYDKVFFNKDVAVDSIPKILKQAIPEIDELVKHPMLAEYAINHLVNDVKVVGYVDCIDANGDIYDFKVTGSSNSDTDTRQSLQLGVYSYCTGNQPKKVGLVSISNKTGKVTPAIVPCSPARGDAAIDALNCGVKSINAAIANHSFLPNTEGWHCSEKWCDYYSVCPWGKHAQGE